MFLENKIYLENQLVDDRISRAIDNDHTEAMKTPSGSKKHLKKAGAHFGNGADMIAVCMLCKKAFKNHLMYRKHMRLHGDKAHQCPLCNKVFGKKHHLQIHMQSHSKHQYQCHLCHKRFSLKGNLNQHLKFHATKKTHTCNICGKDFFQQEHLKAHLRHHSNERPYECELCNKSFNIKSSLQRHMNCHTGEKPFICDICNRGYTRRSVLMLHIQQVHENKKPFQCDACNLCFSQKGNLQAHFRRKHLQPKSDAKRGKDKASGKRGLKRRHPVFAEDPPKVKLGKVKMDNTSLHSYASKVKSIVSRGARSQDAQRITAKSLNVLNLKNGAANKSGHLLPYGKPNMSPNDTGSSSSLSDESPDIGCSSSSGDDMPELNFPNILENSDMATYDIKSLSDYNIFDDEKDWDNYLLTDSDQILSSSIPSYELNDVFSSPIKSNVSMSKTIADVGDELFSWSDADCGTNPLFTAEDLDEIKDISSICGIPIDGIKMEMSDLERRGRGTALSKAANNNGMHKVNSLLS